MSRSPAHDQHADSAPSAQEPTSKCAASVSPERVLWTERLKRALKKRVGQPAFSQRATAKHIGVSQVHVRRILAGERLLGEHHIAALPPTLRDEVQNGTESERRLEVSTTGIRKVPGR